MLGTVALGDLAATLRAEPRARGQVRYRGRRGAASLSAESAIAVGDDCAAIPDGDGYLLFAIEGFMNEFVERDPWFAGWCGVMVNVVGRRRHGRPADRGRRCRLGGEEDAAQRRCSMACAPRPNTYGVPVVGGHTNARTDRGQLSVAILGRAKLCSRPLMRGQRPAGCRHRPARPLSRAVRQLGSGDRCAAGAA